MTEPSLANVGSHQIFHLCAANPSNEEYWSEFVRRFNPLLARSVAIAYKRCTGGERISEDLAADLLQDVYTSIVKDDYRLLRQFRGRTNAEIEAYLAHTAINQTISHLRAKGAQKRQADLTSLTELEVDIWGNTPSYTRRSHTDLTEHELIKIYQIVFAGPHCKRDTLIFLLHFRDGWSAGEIARMRVCELRETSIANLLVRMRIKLKNYFTSRG